MNVRHLLRLRRWAQNPPSVARMKLLLAVAAILILIYGLDYFGYWPDWATSENIRVKPKSF
jgi:hypothetical protein